MNNEIIMKAEGKGESMKKNNNSEEWRHQQGRHRRRISGMKGSMA